MFEDKWLNLCNEGLQKEENRDKFFLIDPVSPKVFFEEWLPPALSPEQLKAIDSVFVKTDKGIEWSKKFQEYLLFWGEGCIDENILIKDVKTKEIHYIKTWAKLGRGFHILAYDFDRAEFKVVKADAPYKKGKADLFEVIIKKNKKHKKIICTKAHKFYTPNGWKSLQELKEGDLIATKNPGDAYLSTKSLEETKVLPKNETHLVFTPISSIKYVKKGDFYDFNVPKYHNYLLRGMLHHNSGKDFLCARILIYCAYWLMCKNNPQKYFNIADNEPIDLVNVSVNASHARDVFFYRFTMALKAVKNPATGGNWFEEQGMDLRDKQDIQTTMVKFKKGIRAHSKHSEKYAGEGLNVLIAVFDEVGEFPVKKAKELYDALWHTETSRYGNQFKMFLISYMRDPQDFMCYRWDKTKEATNVYRSLKKTWEVNPLKKQEDFKEAYEKDPEGSSMRYENINKRGSTNRFFRFETRIRDYAKKRPAPFMDNPLHVNDLLAEALHTWFKPEMVVRLDELLEIDGTKGLKEDTFKKEKEILELQHQDAKYYIHIDLAKANAEEGQDCGGFAMGHTYPVNPFDEESERGVYIDLAIQLRVSEGELDFEMIRKFIYKLQERGFQIAKVTLDGWQSVDFIQRLKDKGIEAETLSIDKSMEPYNTFKSQLYSKQLDYYDYSVLLREAEELIISNGKVDHPAMSRKRAIDEKVEKGSKDVSDAVAGVTFSALSGEPEKVVWFGI